MNAARIIGIRRHRLQTDGDGVTTLVAFNGCPLRCKYCLNPHCWDPDTGKDYTPASLYEKVKVDQLYFLATRGGVTFGGGEPLLYVDFIREFRTLCGPQWQVVVETSLNVPAESVEALDPVLDGYIVDIKDMNPEVYEAYTGKSNDLVLKNLEWLLRHGDPRRITVRVPRIPDFNTDADIERSKARLEKMGAVVFDMFNYIIR